MIEGPNVATINVNIIEREGLAQLDIASSNFIQVHFDLKGKEKDFLDKKINLKAQFRGKADL